MPQCLFSNFLKQYVFFVGSDDVVPRCMEHVAAVKLDSSIITYSKCVKNLRVIFDSSLSPLKIRSNLCASFFSFLFVSSELRDFLVGGLLASTLLYSALYKIKLFVSHIDVVNLPI